MAKGSRSTRPSADAAKQPVTPLFPAEPTLAYLLRREQVQRAFDLLRDETSPCWQMTFLVVYDGWDVEIQRFLGTWVNGRHEPTEYHWVAIDKGGNCFDGSAVSHATPEDAWNAAALEINLFLYRHLQMPGPHGVQSDPALSLLKAVLSSAP